MEDFGSFDNKFLHLENPLPRITQEELHKRAGVRLRKVKSKGEQVFNLDLRYGSGTELKTKTLSPGQKLQVAEKFGREVIEDFKPQGDICATNPGLAWYSKESERKDALLQALMIAEKHYHTCGAVQFASVRDTKGHDDAAVERYKASTYGQYFLNMTKEELIREAIEELQTAPEEKRKAS